jgi:hypothetical protein
MGMLTLASLSVGYLHDAKKLPHPGDRQAHPSSPLDRPATPVYSRDVACPRPVGLPPPFGGARPGMVPGFPRPGVVRGNRSLNAYVRAYGATPRSNGHL